MHWAAGVVGSTKPGASIQNTSMHSAEGGSLRGTRESEAGGARSPVPFAVGILALALHEFLARAHVSHFKFGVYRSFPPRSFRLSLSPTLCVRNKKRKESAPTSSLFCSLTVLGALEDRHLAVDNLRVRHCCCELSVRLLKIRSFASPYCVVATPGKERVEVGQRETKRG